MCRCRSFAVACVFALVLTCRIFLFVTRLSWYAKTMTPKCEPPRQRGSPHQAAQVCRGGYKVVLVWKALAYTDLLGNVYCYRNSSIRTDNFWRFIPSHCGSCCYFLVSQYIILAYIIVDSFFRIINTPSQFNYSVNVNGIYTIVL